MKQNQSSLQYFLFFGLFSMSVGVVAHFNGTKRFKILRSDDVVTHSNLQRDFYKLLGDNVDIDLNCKVWQHILPGNDVDADLSLGKNSLDSL